MDPAEREMLEPAVEHLNCIFDVNASEARFLGSVPGSTKKVNKLKKEALADIEQHFEMLSRRDSLSGNNNSSMQSVQDFRLISL
jgi:hypothetical protein